MRIPFWTVATLATSNLQNYHDLTGKICNVFAISDLHTDHAENMQWVRDQSQFLSDSDLLIVAGDISHVEERFRETLQALQTNARVLFVPGNHEAWLSPNETGDSLDKLQRFYEIAREMGVYVDPIQIGSDWIVPLQSWYDGSLSFDEDLCQGFEKWPWVDFARCKFPFPGRIPSGLVEYFLECNQEQFLSKLPSPIDGTLITVSHFASNSQSLPDWKNLSATSFDLDWLDHGAGAMSAKFAKVAGSDKLGEQLESLRAKRHLHIFGHSHRPKDFEYRGIRYIHNPLGKPRERALHMVNPDVTFQKIWSNAMEVEGPQVLRYWEEYGGGKEMLWKRLEETRPGRYQKSSS